ncbi:LPXTG cell wall anchor domain-containing protein [Actinoplanes flavus]|uniref:LPXTG cell wall anchor domain-containing protein n=1 Tax=Actinoplanes flavus TaxID=2820290 RepID=A0ABS3UC76_9ACTN|nr:LPXTG cell wall anchor domain-containing protein [Actinoplanes flavus]MBO3736031.1 LPXTG cell wall anchor domain-containing protein [Actinoplanes flavus]
MSFSRRLTAGIPTVGATVLAALALGAGPAAASAELVGEAGHVMAAPSPDPVDGQGGDGYGGAETAPPAVNAVTATPPTRGKPGYGGVSETPSPSPSLPTGNVNSVPPAGVSSEIATPKPTQTTAGAGVSSGNTLPVTGSPSGGVVALGGLMVAGGAAAVWYTRRQRNV